MAVKYLSNKVKDLQVGITNYSENKSKSLYVVGNVGVGTTNPTAEVGISNTSVLAVGILTAYRIYSSVYGEFTGDFSGGKVDATDLNVAGISTLGDVKVFGGIVTARVGNTGIVTYYGDGQYLTGIAVTERINTRSLYVSGISTLDGRLSVGGVSTFTGNSTFDGNIDANGDLDVDGHTELDDVNVSGISTFNQLATFSNGINIPTNKTIGLGDTTSSTIEFNSFGVMNRLNKHGASDFTWKLEDEDGTMHMEVRSGTTNSHVQLNQNNNKKLQTKDYGVEITGTTDTDQLIVSGVSTFNEDVKFTGNNTNMRWNHDTSDLTLWNNTRLVFGDNEDFQIWHGGTHTFLKNTGGDLIIRGNSIQLKREDNTGKYLEANVNSDVKLFYNEIEKFATTLDGVNITGHVETDTLNVSGLSTFAGAIDANAGANIANGLSVTSGATFDSAQVSNLTDNRVVIAGTSGALEDSANLTFDGSTLTVGGNVSIAGTITYDDVTNVDSIGLITARSGVRITSGGMNVVGDIVTIDNIVGDNSTNISGISSVTATSFYGNGSNLTNITADAVGELANLKVTGVSTFVNDIDVDGNIVGDNATNISGINSVTAVKYYGDGSGLTGVDAGLWVLNSAGIHTTADVGIGTTNPAAAVTVNNTKKLSVGIVSTYNLYAGDTFVGSAITMYASTGIVSATSFYGEGSNLTDVSWGSSPDHGSSFITQGSQTAVGGDPGDWQVIAGYWAGCCANANTRYNVIFGKSAGRKLADGSRNILIGDEVGCGLTTGNRNVYMGSYSACASVSGDYNVGLGYKTLRTSTGSCNIAIGYCAADGNTSGTSNIAIGKNANHDVGAGGTDNVWIGTYSGGYAGGACNTFIGAESGYGVYNGTFNVGLGFEAGRSTIQQSAHYNVSIGAKAGLLGTTGSCNVFLGLCAGRSVSTGDFNLFAGHKAGDAVTVGACNIYLGNLAGAGSTAGERNIAVGQCAGYSNKTGSYNISFGSCAGYTNEFGCSNVFIGKDAGKLSTASNNVILGNSSGSNLTSGGSNVFLGYDAGLHATTAHGNIFLGTSAGQGDTGQPITGGCNIALGWYAGGDLKDGYENVFIGSRAGLCNDDGSGNVFLGPNAGQNNIDGYSNVFIGCFAGCDNASGACNIAIGHYVNVPLANGNHQLAIGRGTDLWITGNADFNVGIGTTNPNTAVGVGNTAKLSVGIVSAYQLYGDGSALTGVGFKPDADLNLKAGTCAGEDLDGTSGCYNILIGECAGLNMTSGSVNIAIGKLALGNGVVTGTVNTVVGRCAGYDLTSGCYNSIFGESAGRKLTYGDNNTLIGPFAGWNISTGCRNIALGRETLGGFGGHSVDATGSDNIGLGYRAGWNITSGCDNILLGQSAGTQLTTGCCNIAIGKDALSSSALTGNSNVAIGPEAGYTLCSGDKNVLIGQCAGNALYNTDGNVLIGDRAGLVYYCSDSVFIGNSAGLCKYIGHHNIALGSRSMAGNNGGSNSDNTGAFNITLGYRAGNSIASGDHNLFVGMDAGYGSCLTGDHNIFLGKYTAAMLTSGSQNIGFGNQAGMRITEGSENIAIGSSSLSGCCITGDKNIAIGDYAGYGVTTGSQNIMIGRESGCATSSGKYNIFVGGSAGSCTTIGCSNTFIGLGAGQLHVEGDYNFFGGYFAGRCMCNGDSNIGIGQHSLQGSSTVSDNTGSSNVVIGNGAGCIITSGSCNVLLGAQAGDAITQGSCNVAIGYNVALDSATSDLQLAIGRGTQHWIEGDSSFNACLADGKLSVSSSGIVTAVSGIITYYGDGSNLTGDGGETLISGITVQEESSNVGTAGSITILDFQGASVTATASGSNTAVITVTGFDADAQENLYAGTDSGKCSNTHSCFNVALGYHAGCKLGTAGSGWGQKNTFLGYCAGANATNSLCNTFVGAYAGKNTGSGFYNTFLGFCAGESNGSANASVYVGCKAGANANAYYNTFIGGNAAASATGCSNVAIGNDATLPIQNGNFQLAIGSGSNNWINGNSDFNVGIGTTNPLAKLSVDVGTATTAFVVDGSAGQLFSVTNSLSSGSIFSVNDISGIPSIDVDADGTIQLAPYGTGEMVGVGTTNPTSKLHVIGDSLITGVVTATDFNSTSDIRLKTNIKRIEDPLAKVIRIEGVTFDWKEWNKPALGVIADQVEEVIPELVQGTDPKTVNYNGLIGLLIEAVKEQQTQIDNLKERLSKLE